MRGPSLSRSVVACIVVAGCLVGPGAAVALGATRPTERHCSVTVVGEKPSGELQTTPPVCTTGDQPQALGTASAQSTIAIHYVNANFSGSSYTVQGTGCTGGYLNLPADWTNVISSTWSTCTATHFDLYYLGGDSQSTTGSAVLGPLNDRTNSVRYS
jgi:hypothetical protein